MRRKFGKKLMALTMAGVMMCAPMTVFATGTTEFTTTPAEGSAESSGKVEGWVDKEVFDVVLPTVNEDDTTFKFILDPQKLINDTTHAAYGSATFTGAGLYFLNSDGNYTASSDELKAINKSTMDVDVTLTASIDTKLALTSDSTFADDTTNSIYLALVSGSDTKAITSENAAQIDTSIDALENAYKVDYVDDEYVYVIDTDVAATDDDFNSVSFKLTGACNQTAGVDWSSYVDEAPTVKVAWTLSNPNAASASYLSATTVSASSPSVTVTLPEDVTISSVVLNKVGSSTPTPLVSGNTYTYASGTLSIKSTVITANTGATVDVTFSDDHVDTITIQ